MLWNCLLPFSNNDWCYTCGSLYGLSVLFHWFIFVHILTSLDHVDYYSIRITLDNNWQCKFSDSILVFVILNPLNFHIKFIISLSLSANSMLTFWLCWIYRQLWKRMDILTVVFSNTWWAWICLFMLFNLSALFPSFFEIVL